jgi:4'-phosphopantetheinyl transferase
LCGEKISSDAKLENSCKDRLYLFYCLYVGSIYYPEIENFLTYDEKTRAGKFHFPELKNTYVLAHAFLNYQLSKKLKCTIEQLEFAFNAHQKPLITNSSISFNLSHSNNSWAVVIADNCEMGVDIEFINEKKNLFQITEYYFSHDEQIRVNCADNPVREFYKIWTRKEAYLKMKGIGINADLQKIDVERNCQYKAGLVNSTQAPSCYIETFEFPNHVISIAQSKHLTVLAEEVTNTYEILQLLISGCALRR